MKRWAVVTIALYTALLLLVTLPLIVLAGITWYPRTQPPHLEISFREALAAFGQWYYWLWIAVFVSAQAALLVIPIRATERRPVKRRNVGWMIGAASFLFANVLLGGVFSLLFGIFGDAGGAPIEFFGEQAAKNPILVQAAAILHVSAPSSFALGVGGLIAALLTIWGVWFVLFYRFSVAEDPATLNAKLVRWLLRGSILELLVAVPSHIAVRGRNDCCAPAGTFWGIATGISVMLIAFGPGTFFLFAHRFRRLQPANPGRKTEPSVTA